MLLFVIPLYLDAFVTIVGALCRGCMSLCKKNKAPKPKVTPERAERRVRAAGLVVCLTWSVHRGQLACLTREKKPVVRVALVPLGFNLCIDSFLNGSRRSFEFSPHLISSLSWTDSATCYLFSQPLLRPTLTAHVPLLLAFDEGSDQGHLR